MQQQPKYYDNNEQFRQYPYYDQTDDVKLINDGQIDEMGHRLNQTTTHRVAAAMYPEAIDSGMEIPSTQYTYHQTAVQRLTEPAQMLRQTVVNLINYQDDADLAAQALPELIKLLNDADQLVVGQAAMIANQLSKREASRHALSNSTPLIKALIHALEHSNNVDTTKNASETLSGISQNAQGLLAIFKTGGIRALIHALSSSIDAVVFHAMKTLHNLLLHQEGSKMNVRLNGGLQKMVGLLQRDDSKFLALVTDCIHILCYGNQEGKLIILASGGPSELVRILHSYSYEKLLLTTARVLKVLSVCPNNKTAILQSGGMQVLALCLNHQSKRLVQECLWTIRNLSDSATKEINMEPLLLRLVQLLEDHDINVVTCAVGTLSNLTCNNDFNKAFVCKAGAVQALISTLRNAGDRNEIVEPAVCALRHLTSRHNEVTLAMDSFRMHGGFPYVTRLLDFPREWALLSASSGLVRNLALDHMNIGVLRESSVVQKLSILLTKAYQALQESSDDTSNLAGIKMERVVESVLLALHAMSLDYQNRIIINSMNILIVLISLLYNENESIVIVTLDLLAELAREPELASNIKVQSGVQVISGLLNSSVDPIRQRAGLLLSMISGDKIPEYTQRLSSEINSLFQGDTQRQTSINGQQQHTNDPWFDTDL